MNSEFAKQLLELRLRAGYASQSAAIKALKRYAENLRDPSAVPSKSMLSLYERGEVNTLKPQTLRLIAEVYGTSYEELASAWFSARYGVSIRALKSTGHSLEDPASESKTKLLSLEAFREGQGCLPEGTQIGVCATTFVDSELFFDLLLSNLRRRIAHYFLLPEDERLSFDACLQQLLPHCPDFAPEDLNQLMQFYRRLDLDFPVSYVVYLLPNNCVQGFIALPVGDRPYYYQVADIKQSLRLYESFCWTMTLTQDPELKRRLGLLRLDAEQSKMAPALERTKTRSFKSFAVCK